MKMKAIGFSIALLAVAVMAVPASAAIVASDSFGYADGNLVGNGGWAPHSGSASFIQVAAGEAVVAHGGGSREDVNLGFAAVPGVSMYYGIDFSVDDLLAPYGNDGTPDFEYFAHFKDGGFNFSARLDIVAATGLGDYSVGIASDDSVADAVWATDLTYGVTYRAIVRYDQVDNVAELWIDAAVPGDTSILGTNQTWAGDTVSQFALRQSWSDANETVRVDNLIVGTTFGDVVPEPATIALLGFGALALIRRRR